MESFDYVVVGAGSAGCALANRLTADGRYRVLLVEAGGSDRSFWVRMPIGYGRTFHDPRFNWRFTTEPVPGLGGRTSYWPRGRVLGGSSSINAMVYIRGQHQDFDDWAALGNPGWAWADVGPVFRRMENTAAGADDWRGAGGPLDVADVRGLVHPLCETWMAACEAAGLGRNPDFNGAEQEGVGIYQITTRGGVRASAATAYLRPAMGRPNLKVETGAQVTRVRFEGRRAVGVDYVRGGVRRAAAARGEVILSAGAVMSPVLLQLSGVGDPERLLRHGVAVVHDLDGVGRNLQDHLGIDYLYRSRVPTLNQVLRPWAGRLRAGARYLARRDGPLSLSVNQAGGFFRTRPELARPNMQLYFSPVSYLRAAPGRRRLAAPDPWPGMLLGLSNCRPTSRGWLAIRSPDPLEPPEIQPNYLDSEEDLAEMLEAVRFLRRLAATAPLAGVVEAELAPGAAVTGEAALVADIRARAGTLFHASGTCAMGPDPAGAVVDPRLRVHGLACLRVVDASIFPRVTSGNTNAPSIMVGERGAELVLEDAKAR
jgi:choline dehydrogenase